MTASKNFMLIFMLFKQMLLIYINAIIEKIFLTEEVHGYASLR